MSKNESGNQFHYTIIDTKTGEIFKKINSTEFCRIVKAPPSKPHASLYFREKPNPHTIYGRFYVSRESRNMPEDQTVGSLINRYGSQWFAEYCKKWHDMQRLFGIY